MSRVGSSPLCGAERARYLWALTGICVWLATVGAGMGLLTSYSNEAGATLTPPESLAQLESAAPGSYRLLMFAHPHCPCTAASMRELSRVLSRNTDSVIATVHFFRPEQESDSWVHGRLWSAAETIPGLRVEIDPGGLMAAQFRSTTSGEVLLYDPSGHLRFQGGITPGRGHEGDNLGKSAVMSIVMGEQVNVVRSPAFGCTVRPASALLPE